MNYTKTGVQLVFSAFLEQILPHPHFPSRYLNVPLSSLPVTCKLTLSHRVLKCSSQSHRLLPAASFFPHCFFNGCYSFSSFFLTQFVSVFSYKPWEIQSLWSKPHSDHGFCRRRLWLKILSQRDCNVKLLISSIPKFLWFSLWNQRFVYSFYDAIFICLFLY